MVFQSNPGFIFHDSRGFEAGGESEFDQVKAFIARRSKETNLKDQVYAIWYGTASRWTRQAGRSPKAKSNFSLSETPEAFDALYDVEFTQLRAKGLPSKEAKELAPKHAEESFAHGPQLKFLRDVRRPPKCHTCLPNMNRDDADCESPIERTAGTLDDEVLQQLLFSTQQANLELCMKYAIERTPGLLDSAET